MQKVNEIYKTTDYDLFIDMPGNRNVSPKHLEEIKNSLEEKLIPMPIVVTPSKRVPGKFEIFEGQHRAAAAKIAHLPIYFCIIEDLSIADAIIINTTSKKWTADDYFNHYIELGNENYIQLRRFMEITGLSLNNARMFCDTAALKSNPQRRAFKDGGFMIKDFNNSLDLFNMHLDYKDCHAFTKFIFKTAVLKVMRNKEYEHERMKNKLAQVGYKVGMRATVSDYVEALTEVYNYNSGKDKKVYFYLEN